MPKYRLVIRHLILRWLHKGLCKKKLEVFKRDVDGVRFTYFPNLKRHINDLLKDNRTDRQSL